MRRSTGHRHSLVGLADKERARLSNEYERDAQTVASCKVTRARQLQACFTFVLTPTSLTTVLACVRVRQKGVDQICIPWIMFGSGGRDKQVRTFAQKQIGSPTERARSERNHKRQTSIQAQTLHASRLHAHMPTCPALPKSTPHALTNSFGRHRRGQRIVKQPSCVSSSFVRREAFPESDDPPPRHGKCIVRISQVT